MYLATAHGGQNPQTNTYTIKINQSMYALVDGKSCLRMK